MSDEENKPETLEQMVKRLESKYAGTDERIAKLESRQWTAEELADATRRKRIELGLPVPGLDAYLKQRGVPEKFWQLVLNPWRTDALGLVERLLAGEGLLLVLGGDTGRGKSCAAAVALARRPGVWVHSPDLAKPPVKKKDAEDEDEETVRDGRMRSAPLLVLDEVGLEHSPGGYAASRITATLSIRDSNNRPTIVTTNLSAPQFKEKYGDRIGSRLNGDPLGFQTVKGPDYRQTKVPFNERGEK